MRFRRLELRKYGRFDAEVEVEFSDSGIDVIIGANETGKSTIMDGILTVIFGLSKTTEKEMRVPWSKAESGTGSLDIEQNGSFSIRREIGSQFTTLTKNSDELPLELFKGDAKPGGTKESSQYFKKLNENLSLTSREVLESLTFINQNAVETKIDGKIREVISGIGSGDYLKANKKLKEEAESLTKNVSWAKRERQDRKLEKLENKLMEIKQELDSALTAREVGGDKEEELKELKSKSNKLEKILKKEEEKLADFGKYIESLKEHDRAVEREEKLAEELITIKKQELKLEENEALQNLDIALSIRKKGGRVKEELSQYKTDEERKAELSEKVENLRSESGISAPKTIPGVWKTAAVLTTFSLSFILAWLSTNSVQMSSLVAVFFGTIVFIIVDRWRFKSADERSARITIRLEELENLEQSSSEIKEKYAPLLEKYGIDVLLKEFTDMKDREKESDLIREILGERKSSEDLKKESKKLLQSIRMRVAEMDEMEQKNSELLKADRKLAECKALEAEQKTKVILLSEEKESLKETSHSIDTELAERRGRGVGNVDLLGREAAELEEQIEETRLEADALKLAVSTLNEAVEEFQETHHGRLSERISDWFNRFTEERYSSVELDDNWAPQIRTKEGRTVEIDVLSTGARDQLYFAMRLALAELMSQEVSLPIVLDDPFVHYDSDRLKISKKILTEISKEHQVILFSHSPEYKKWGNVVLDLDSYWKARN